MSDSKAQRQKALLSMMCEPGLEAEFYSRLDESGGSPGKASAQARSELQQAEGSKSHILEKLVPAFECLAGENSRIAEFLQLCKKVLRKLYSDRESMLIAEYGPVLERLTTREFATKMDEFRRSVAGTPRGELVLERRASGPGDDAYHKLRTYLSNLLEV